MIRPAPATIAPSRHDRPTPPSPTTATVSPAFTSAVFTAAPTPVTTAQPNSAASCIGTSAGIFCTELRGTTAYSAKHDSPELCAIDCPLRLRRRPPVARSPFWRAALKVVHRFGRCEMHWRQWPQLGAKMKTTLSPALMSVTPAPTSATTPAPSWPTTIGSGRGRTPSIVERSEWQSPAALTWTRTSPARGPSRSSVSIRSGLLCAYGRGRPCS
jgi:hypothetical protein